MTTNTGWEISPHKITAYDFGVRCARLTGLLLLCGLLLTLAPAARAQTATSTPRTTLTVTTLTDNADTPGSLRYQLNRANASTSTPTTILFDTALSGGTITPTSPLRLSGNIQLLAQDADELSIDMTLDGSQLPAGSDVLTISSRNATVSGFDIVNVTSAGLFVSSSYSQACMDAVVERWRKPAPPLPVTGRITLSDNVLTLATSTAVGIEVHERSYSCAAVTIRENRIAADTSEPGSRGTGIDITVGSNSSYQHLDATVSANTITGTGTGIYFTTGKGYGDIHNLDATVSANTITGTGTGIYFTTRGDGMGHRMNATVSANTVTGTGTGTGIYFTTGEDGNAQTNARVSSNTITGTGTGIYFTMRGSAGNQSLDATVSANTVTSTGTGIYFTTGRGGGNHRTNATVSANTVTSTGDGIYFNFTTSGNSDRTNAIVSTNTVTSTGNGIYFTMGEGGDAQTNAIVSTNTVTSTGTGIYFTTKGDGGSHRTNATVSANTVTGTGTGIYLTTKGEGGGHRTNATVSANTVTGTGTGIYLATGGGGGGHTTNATLSDNRITGARHGIKLLGTTGYVGSHRTKVRGSGNTVIGSGIVDIFASDGENQVNGHLENTVFNTADLSGVRKRPNRFTLHKRQAAALPAGGITAKRQNPDGTIEVVTVTTIEEKYLSDPAQVADPTQREEAKRALAVVSSQTDRLDFGTNPVIVSLIPRDAKGRAVSGGLGQSVRVCLPPPADLSGASALRIVRFDGTVWRPLSSHRSGSQICTNVSGFSLFGVAHDLTGSTNGGGGTRSPAPPQRRAAAAEATTRGTDGGGSSSIPPPGHSPLVGVLENPAGGSSQSGIGLLSGWVCEAEVVEVEINGDSVHRLEAAYGTGRADTAAVCANDGNNGFGLLLNWNLLGEGAHTIRALADGVEFDRATFTVTTTGEEFLRGTSGQVVVADFPSPGEQVRLVWQQSLQNFVLAPLSPAAVQSLALPPASSAGPSGVLENPAGGSSQSGIGLLSGWVCEAEVVEVEINGDSVHRLEAAYGTGRADTADVCANDGNNGFGLLLNWNLLGEGAHTVRVLADGVEFDRATFTVTTTGEEFLRGASGQAVVADFPSAGETVTLTWQESSQSFVITHIE